MRQTELSSINEVEQIIGKRKYLLIHGKSFDKLNIKQDICKMNCAEFVDFSSNPSYDEVCEGLYKYRSFECNAIIAVGGGSAIDVAKCIKLFSVLDEKADYLKHCSVKSDVPLIVAPTTAGTGSESTRHAVIYKNGEKISICNDSIIPDFVIFDPSALITLSEYQKKCTLMDALCQAIESWWSKKATNESIGYSQKSIKLLFENWESYLYDCSIESCEKVLKGANYSGRAINITATTAAHAMSYKLTSLFGIPHGHAVAICMIEVWNYLRTYYYRVGESNLYLDKIVEIEKIISYDNYVSMVEKMHLASPVSKNRNSEIMELVSSVNIERLVNTPIEIDRDILAEMYERIVK